MFEVDAESEERQMFFNLIVLFSKPTRFCFPEEIIFGDSSLKGYDEQFVAQSHLAEKLIGKRGFNESS